MKVSRQALLYYADCLQNLACSIVPSVSVTLNLDAHLCRGLMAMRPGDCDLLDCLLCLSCGHELRRHRSEFQGIQQRSLCVLHQSVPREEVMMTTVPAYLLVGPGIAKSSIQVHFAESGSESTATQISIPFSTCPENAVRTRTRTSAVHERAHTRAVHEQIHNRTCPRMYTCTHKVKIENLI